MGVSTDAMLYYGMDIICEEEDEPLITRPDDFPEEEWNEDLGWHIERYLTTKGIAVQVGVHCSYDYPTHYIHVYELTASRGYPVSVVPASLTISESQQAELTKALDILKVPMNQRKVGWYLASLWG